MKSRSKIFVVEHQKKCLSCNRYPMKYITGLCNKCHRIVIHADTSTSTAESIIRLTRELFKEEAKR